MAHLVTRPAVHTAIKINRRQGEDPCEKHHNAAEGQAIAEVDLVQIAENHQQRDRHRREVEGIEEPRNGLGCEQGILVLEIPASEVGITGTVGASIEIDHRVKCE